MHLVAGLGSACLAYVCMPLASGTCWEYLQNERHLKASPQELAWDGV